MMNGGRHVQQSTVVMGIGSGRPTSLLDANAGSRQEVGESVQDSRALDDPINRLYQFVVDNDICCPVVKKSKK